VASETVPAGWSNRRLGEFCREVRQRAQDAQELPILSVSKDLGIILQSEKFKKRIASDNTESYWRIRRGQFAYDPMLLWTGSVSRQDRVDEGLISPAYCAFELDGSVDHDFVLQVLRWEQMVPVYRNISVGTNVRRRKAPFDSFAAIELPLPPLAEQKKIAAILSSVDEAIRANDAVIEQTRRVKEGLLQELLTRGIGHTEFRETEIGPLPVGWDVRTISALGKVVTGRTPPGSRPELWGDSIPFVTPGDLSDDTHTVSSSQRSLHSMAEAVIPVVPAGSILVTCIGATIGKHGLAARPVAFNQQINAIVASSEHDPWFVYYVVEASRERIRSLAGHQAVPIVNKSLFSSVRVAVPPAAEQSRIARVLRALDDEAAAVTMSISRLQALKSGLLQDLLTGKVRVTP